MTSELYKTVLLCGAPGAGKGTQGKILGSIPGFFHLSCGDVFRTININSELSQKICEYTARGDLVPDDITVELWQENMNARTVLNDYKPNTDLLVLDGIPRNAEQAELLTAHIEVLKVVHLVCADKEKMIERLRRRALKENRADDAREEVIRPRWDIYEEESRPLLAFYPSENVIEVDATQSPSEVLTAVSTSEGLWVAS
ncbi:MAG: nucleoside monophosphate kinase, partial [Planctomycetes bacterium]|nr:nucleoside monophosphate kinase [Planctomycetota bacterium]